MLEKLKFWKKDDEFDDLPSTPFPEPGHGQPGFQTQPNNDFSPFPDQPAPPFPRQDQPDFMSQNQFHQAPSAFDQHQEQFGHREQSQANDTQRTLSQQVELINVKLDAIKSAIENINMRLERMEQRRY